MCGRYVLKSAPRHIREQFGIVDGVDPSRDEEWRPRFNLAPQQYASVVREIDGHRRLDTLRWGLIPSWAKDEDFAYRTINARGETVSRLPAFRAAFKARRCIVPADAFYEWQATAGSKQKQPWYIHRADGQLLGLAGLWEHWRQEGQAEPLETFTIVTTTANAWMLPLHPKFDIFLRKPLIRLCSGDRNWHYEAMSKGSLVGRSS